MVQEIDTNQFREQLLNWWEKNKRDFPWRNTRDPYMILIAEVLLHRTKAEQVAKIYPEFLRRFPSLKILLHASTDEIRELLRPLGLHWRTELLLKMIAKIAESYGGEVPFEREILISLPGVSHYIASAVRCFAFGYPEVLLDTNTVRILGRVFGVKVTDCSRRSNYFNELYRTLISREENVREFNFAMIDLGALICKPANPQCSACPLRELCKHGICAKEREK